MMEGARAAEAAGGAANLSKWFLVTRIAILAALLFVVAAAFWGWTHQTRPSGSSNGGHLEKYNAKKPGAGTTAFFVISVFAGILIVSFSIWLEWGRAGGAGGPPGDVAPSREMAERPSTGLTETAVMTGREQAKEGGSSEGMASPGCPQPLAGPGIAVGRGHPAGEGTEGAGEGSGAEAREEISGDEPQ